MTIKEKLADMQAETMRNKEHVAKWKEENTMDAQDRKSDLQEARKLLVRAKKLLGGCGAKYLAWGVNDLLNDLDDEIRDADERCHAEQKLENAALTRAYFEDAIGAFNRI